MIPDRPFYLLDDGSGTIPPLFYPMLNKALPLPLLPGWAEVLWAHGRAQELITLLDDGEGQGVAAWRVRPAGEMWQEIVEGGLQRDLFHF